MKPTKTTLSNGVRIVTIPMTGNPTVTVLLYVATGSFYERPERAGLSHFLEHMCFKGTLKRPSPRDITEELDSIGASYNAFTSCEETGYWVKSDVRHFDTITDVVSDIVKNSTFPESEIEKEKGVVKGEIDMYADEPQEKLYKALAQHMYQGEPAEREVLGTKETVSSFTRSIIKAYRDSQYVGKKLVVTIAGGVSEQMMVDWATQTFKDIPDTKPLSLLATRDREQKLPETVFVDKDIDQAHVVLTWRAFDSNHKDRFILRIIRAILRGGMSSRLFVKLREEMGAGYYVSASTNLYKTFGNFMIGTGTTAERVPEIISAILGEIQKIQNHTVSDKEFTKVKEFIRAHRVMGLETSDDIAHFYGGQEVSKGEMLSPKEFDDIYNAITSADIQRVAREVFVPQRLTCAVIGKNIDTEAVRLLLHNTISS